MTDFSIQFGGEITLTTDQIWPDGDGPEKPTADDVKAVMERSGSKRIVLSDWCLIEDLEVYVSTNPAGNEVEVWGR